MNASDRIGPYTLVSRLGRPDGRTWLASACDGQVQVALKLASKTDQIGRAHLLHEMDMAAHFDHPNIVRMHECAQVNDLMWVATGYVGGGTVLTLANFRQLLLALLHVHGNGVVHGDISPNRLLLEPQGDLRLANFRYARKVGQAASQEGGRSPYASPEQHLGDVLDTRADIYGAGAVLYELLTRSIHQPAPLAPPSVLAPGLGTNFDAVVARALAPDKSARFGHVFEFLSAFDAACQRGVRVVPGAER